MKKVKSDITKEFGKVPGAIYGFVTDGKGRVQSAFNLLDNTLLSHSDDQAKFNDFQGI